MRGLGALIGLLFMWWSPFASLGFVVGFVLFVWSAVPPLTIALQKHNERLRGIGEFNGND